MNKLRIVVVDDEPHLTGALCRALSLLDGIRCQPEDYPSAEAALETLEEQPVDLLITDLCLPSMDGLALIERTRRAWPAARTVLITGYGTPQIEALSQTMADAYLAKPFSLSHLAQVVRGLVEQDHQPDA